MNKHTPGPWMVAGRDTRNLPHSLVAAETLLVRVYSKHFGDVAEEEANASLISAAPELLAALQESRKFVERQLHDGGYGFYRPANPHDFSPDPDCCSPEEIAAHKADCEAFDRGEYIDDQAQKSGWSEDGTMHVTRNSWGIGVFTYTDQEVAEAIEMIDSAIAKATGK